jgi:hypothetical protein
MKIVLLKQRHKYLYKKVMARLKLNEIRTVTKMGNFNKEEQIKVQGSFFKKVAKDVLQ